MGSNPILSANFFSQRKFNMILYVQHMEKYSSGDGHGCRSAAGGGYSEAAMAQASA